MRRLVDTLNIVISVLAGCFMVGFMVQGAQLSEQMQTASDDIRALLLGIIGIAVVALNLVLAIQDLRKGTFRRDLVVTTEEGVNTLSLSALERHLLDTFNGVDDLSGVHITLHTQSEGQPLLCQLSFKLKNQDDVMKRVDELKKQVRDRFLHLIPSGVGIEISANISDLVDMNKPSTPVAPPSSTFSGPVYPESEDESETDDSQA